MAFFDGQNLYQHAKDAFGHHHPNFDPVKLHKAVCDARGKTAASDIRTTILAEAKELLAERKS